MVSNVISTDPEASNNKCWATNSRFCRRDKRWNSNNDNDHWRLHSAKHFVRIHLCLLFLHCRFHFRSSVTYPKLGSQEIRWIARTGINIFRHKNVLKGNGKSIQISSRQYVTDTSDRQDMRRWRNQHPRYFHFRLPQHR